MSNHENAERAVLGSCLVDANAYWKIADMLVPADFSRGEHAHLFTEIKARAARGDEFDAVTIGDDVPGLFTLALDCASSDGWRQSNVIGYAQAVAKSAMARRIKRVGAQIAHLEGDDMLAQAQRMIAECAPRNVGAVKHIREYLRMSSMELMRRHNSDDKLTGIQTGIKRLDELTEGWQPSDLIIVAARPSVGKTAFALQCALAAAKTGKNVLVFSLEMSGTQLNDRITSAIGPVDGRHLRNPKQMPEEGWPRWSNACAQIQNLPIYIDDSSGVTVEVIGARARQQHAITPLSMIVIDYLTLIAQPKAEKVTDALQIITRSLKWLAKELNVPVMVLSQLNRGGEGQRPTMKTLRDSGAIEQDADVILFLHRPSDKHRDFLELILEKQRNGPTGDLAINANMKHMTMTQASSRPEGVSSNAETSADIEWDELETNA